MATGIQWTDETWNPVTGCSKVSPGCAHCYAASFAFRGLGRFGHKYAVPSIDQPGMMARRKFEDVRCHDDALALPLRWKRPRRIFVNSMSDLFHESVPDAFIDRVFAVMALSPQHTFQVLTKRAERMRSYLSDPMMGLRVGGDIMRVARGSASAEAATIDITHKLTVGGRGLPNVWLGVSVENQRFADERIPQLLQTPAAIRFISAEPLLGPINFRWAQWDNHAPHPRRAEQLPAVQRDGRELAGSVSDLDGLRMLDWVIVGGESGSGARPFDVDWARTIHQQCRKAGVACFIKQLGAKPIGWWSNSLGPRVGKFKDSHGGDIAEWPVDLRVREFPRSPETRPQG
jgi:protein gp37